MGNLDPHEDLENEISHNAADFAFDFFFTGAIGGSAIAIFFLVVDALNGQPLYTPSLMGEVLFTGAAADSVSGVRLDMVAAYSAVHFGIFLTLGGIISIAVHEVELHSHHPLLVLGGLLALFEAGFAIAAGFMIPGVIQQVGPGVIVAANVLAAMSVGGFLFATHRPRDWAKLKHAVHLA